MMEFVNIGGNTRVSRLAFGGAPMGGYDYGVVDETEVIAAIREALDRGVNFFDVADIYGFGRAEEILGRALEGRRSEAFVATKFGLRRRGDRVRRDASAAWIMTAVGESLRRLRTDTIDLYQLHWPDAATPIDETAGALRNCIESGKIRFVGCSNLSVGQVRELAARVHVSAVQVPFNLLCREAERDLVPWCAATGIAVLAHSPLARGLLAGKRPIGERFEGDDTRTNSAYFMSRDMEAKRTLIDKLRRVGADHGSSAAAIAVRWVLDQPGIACALVGVKNRQQLSDQLEVVSTVLPPTEMKRLSDLSADIPGVMTGVLARAGEPVYSHHES